MGDTIVQNKKRYIGLRSFAKLMGISRQGLEERVKRNSDNIVDSCIVVYFTKGARKIAAILPYSEKDNEDNENNKREVLKRFFIEESYSLVFRKKNIITPREKELFEKNYYIVLSHIEEKLTSEERSIATSKQKWLNMNIADVEICGEIFYLYEIEHDKQLSKDIKKSIRIGIDSFIFPTNKSMKIAIKYLSQMAEEIGV